MNLGSTVLGLLNGLTFGLLGIGLVLVYKSNRFLNLAHAQLGALAAQVLAKLVLDEGFDWWVAAAVCIPIGIVAGLASDRWVIRPLRERSASAVSLLLVTVGITQIIIGISSFSALGANQNKLVTQGYPLPFNATAHIGGVVLNSADLLIAAVVPLTVVLLALFLQKTKLGKTIRAAASNPDAARLCGISARRVSAITWGIAGGLSALTAILEAPTQSTFAATSLGPTLLLVALGAAAMGAFTSITGAMVGGVLIGLVQQYTLAETSNGGDAEVAGLLLILLIVLVRGGAIGRVFAVAGSPVRDRSPLQIPAAVRDMFSVRYGRPVSVMVAVGAAILLPLVPSLTSEGQRFHLALIVVYALAALSLTVAIGWAGQVSLGQFALVGSGAFIASRLLVHGWSLPFVIIPAGIVGALVMIAVGLPAVRVPGLTLAVTTVGLALVAPDWLFRQSWFGSAQTFGVSLTPPVLARGLGRPGSQIAVYYFGLLVLVGAALGLHALRRSQAGRIMIAVRDNEAASASFGVTPATVKLGALALSGFLAATAGVVWADAWRVVSASQFTPEVSLSLLAIPVIGGLGSVGGAVAAATVFYAATFFIAPHIGSLFGPLGATLGFQVILGGLGLVVTILRAPYGIAGGVQRWWQHRLDRLAANPPVTEAPARPTLTVSDVRIHFGGVMALDGAEIEVRPGEIVGLIGPNGAGKTTLLNVISGRLQADSGAVHLGGIDITGMAAEIRSAFGLGRSFQDAHLFPGLTVREAVQVAMAKRFRSGVLASGAGAPWVKMAEANSRRSADAILERLGLVAWQDILTSELSTGTRRICDLAAQVASQPSVLLLDEPTAGVAQREAEAFGPLLRRIRDELDCSILIVEHDMPLLMGLCDRIYAMVAGRVISSGTPQEVREDPQVIASYLGTDEVAVTRSGTRKPSDPLELQLAGVSTPAAGSNGKTAPVKRASPARRTPTKKAQSVTARKRPAAGEP
jgi:ABC-type branched-subunit amino acid transport system ATPase component/ABC-type branched-subunit amino acid transport system permease subunit